MPLGEQMAPHFARRVLQADGPAQQRSTLDARLQRLALASLRQQLAELSGRNVEDGAIVVLDNVSGDVLAWVGSSGGFSDAPEVDGVLARRQPGSTLKPFVYALGASLIVPAVRVATLLGPDALFERLNLFGLALPESGGYYGHALALGGADVTLLALRNAYRALANGGVLSPPTLRPGVGPVAGQRVANAAAVYLVTDILADNSARAGAFGLSSALATRGLAAVKTGTSKDLRDNWCIGFTDRYTVGVWVGNTSAPARR